MTKFFFKFFIFYFYSGKNGIDIEVYMREVFHRFITVNGTFFYAFLRMQINLFFYKIKQISVFIFFVNVPLELNLCNSNNVMMLDALELIFRMRSDNT